MKTIFRLFFLLALIIIPFGKISAENCMRCLGKSSGSVLLCEGDSKFDAMNKCGNPDFMDETGTETLGSFGSRTKWNTMWGTVSRKSTGGGFVETTERIEKWYYNCGYGSFSKILTFRGSNLVSIENSDERGSGPQKCW